MGPGCPSCGFENPVGFKFCGACGSALAGEFERMHLRATTEPVETVLHGRVEDQAALHCLLRRIEAFGLELIDIRREPS